ncbi:hypothetical protein [Gloeobacter morelensis]|uniref:hypothetical protein n=1 Tax=Gloeobacter morelensis TaxID=2907343 RepID=UPI001E476ECF|nr:hypothetical protein [Gloeobacter morelensis]UFP97261.1 hypothetical protein ISF26_24375 [Gloeobacter morelensis MG652769]
MRIYSREVVYGMEGYLPVSTIEERAMRLAVEEVGVNPHSAYHLGEGTWILLLRRFRMTLKVGHNSVAAYTVPRYLDIEELIDPDPIGLLNGSNEWLRASQRGNPLYYRGDSGTFRSPLLQADL